MRLIAALNDTGTHTIHIVATDNSSPALKDSIEYVVVIKSCGKKDTTAGISQITNMKENFAIYPNPNKGVFTLQSQVVNGQWSVEIYNMLGEKVYSNYQLANPDSYRELNYQIDLSSQPSGMYFYLIKDTDGNMLGNGKFIIE